MKCSEVKSYLSDYIDGLMKGELKKRLKEHLDMCVGCTEELESLRSLKSTIGELQEIEASADPPGKVYKRIDQMRTAGRIVRTLFSRGRLRLPFELAAGLAAALMVVLVLAQPAIRWQKNESGSVADERVNVSVDRDDFIRKTEITSEEFKKISPLYDEAVQIPESAHVEYSKHKPYRKKVEKQIVENELHKPSDSAAREAQSLARLSRPEEDKKVIELVLLIRPETVNLFEIHRRENAFPADEESVEKEVQAAPSVKTDEYMEKEKAFMLFNTYEKIRELVVKSEGKVVSSSKSIGGLPQSITAAIPPYSYDEFLDDLRTVGIFERSDLTGTQRGAEMIELAIQFVSTF